MLQGEIWKANLNPIRGSEQAGFRPVVIVSGNLMNKYLQVVICYPLTSKIKKYKGNLVLTPNDENNLKAPSEILTLHIRSISKERLVKKVGKIAEDEVKLLISNLNEILSY